MFRGKNQIPQYKIEIYDSTNTLIEELSDLESFSVSVDENAFVKRNFSLSVNNKDGKYTFFPSAYRNNLYWYDKTLKIYAKFDGQASYYNLGTFKIDTLPNSISKAFDLISVGGRDISKNIITSRFTDIKDYSGGGTTTNKTITLSTATNHIGIGDNLVDYAESITYYAVINGVRTKVLTDTYTGSDATRFEADILIDLKATFGVTSVTVTSTDTVGTIEKSTDGGTWSAFSAGNVRYLRFTIINYDDFTINYTDLAIVSSADYPIKNAYDGDSDTFYLPTINKPIMTFAFASGTINTVVLDWNLTDYKQETITYEIGTIASDTYTKLETVTGAGRIEHAFSDVTADKVRIEILTGYGALREVAISQNATTGYFLDEAIKDILTDCGFADFTNIKATHYYANDLVFHSGDEKYQALQTIADSIGWEFYFDSAGLPNFKPIYYINPVYDIEIGQDNIFGYDIEINDNISNQVLVINNDGSEGITYTATDDDITSSTSTVYLGIRTKVLRVDKADTQGKAESLARKELIKSKSQQRTFNLSMTALPQLEIYDTVRFIDSARGINSECRIESINYVYEKGRFTMSIKVVELWQ